MTAKTHVAYCVDKQYYQHFGASVTSLLKNHGQDSDTLHIHVFTDSDDASLKLKLASLQNAFGARFETHILSAKETRIFSGLPLVDYISVATYFRFLMADLLPAEAERVIYLDADTIVLSSIRQLYEIDMQHRTIAGVTDFSAQPMQERLGLRHYINAGVLLIDLQRWRKNNYSRRCIDYARSHGDKLVFADQCVINLVLQDDTRLLPSRWNTFVLPDGSGGNIDGAAILHFITSDKPWQAWYENPAAEIYWKYLEMSPWRGQRQSRPAISPRRSGSPGYCINEAK